MILSRKNSRTTTSGKLAISPYHQILNANMYTLQSTALTKKDLSVALPNFASPTHSSAAAVFVLERWGARFVVAVVARVCRAKERKQRQANHAADSTREAFIIV